MISISTILIVLLVLMLLGRYPRGATAETGVMLRAAAWA